MYFFDKHPDFKTHTLFEDDCGRTATYETWYAHADELGGIVPSRSLAAIVCRNTIGSALSYLCCLQHRVVPLLLDEAMDDELKQSLLAAYRPEFIFCPHGTENGEPLYSLYDYDVYRHNDTSPALYEDLGLLLTTSGSTGSPKLVRLSYDNLQSNAASIAQYLELTAVDRPVSSLPMHYTFGLSVINSHVLCGAAECLTTATVFDAAFWQFCKEKRVTSIAGVPFTYECLRRLKFTKMDLPDLTLMIQAGGKLSKKLQKEFGQYAAATGKRFVVMYGQTEATARMSYLPPADCLRKIGSIGIAIPGGSFCILDDDHAELTEPNAIGELCYDGPNVSLGYAYSADDLQLGDERHGRLFTGDLAYCDEDGFYYIAGRKKRFVKIMGKRVNMDEVEQLFKNAFADRDFACTGGDDDLIVFTTAPETSLSALEDFLVAKTSLHPSCFTIRTVAAIPKNSSGKTQYTDLPTAKD